MPSIGSDGCDIKRDIFVIGASAGGVQALESLVKALPPKLSAVVLVVLHRPPDYASMLSEILRRAGPLQVSDAIEGEVPRYGRIYTAATDRHLVIEHGILRLVRGPKENHSRPAIDPLFRSAAQEFGRRVVGIILSGTLFDGTSGLFAIKRQGGLTIVQDPNEASFPSMPESAIGNVAVDHILPVAEIAALLVHVAARNEVNAGDIVMNSEMQSEVTTAMSAEGSKIEMSNGPSEFDTLPRVVEHDREQQLRGERHGRTSLYTCPECGGTLWQADDMGLLQFRCHVGHVYTGEGMAREQNETLERSLWMSVRLVKDKVLLLRQLARSADDRGDRDMARRLDESARKAEAHERALQNILAEEGL